MKAPVSVVSKKLAKIEANPRAGWTIEDIQTACKQLKMTCSAPTRGSHHKVSSQYIEGILTIPAARPIKEFYIKSFLGLAKAHIEARKEEAANG